MCSTGTFEAHVSCHIPGVSTYMGKCFPVPGGGGDIQPMLIRGGKYENGKEERGDVEKKEKRERLNEY